MERNINSIKINFADPPETKLRLLMSQPQLRQLLKEHFRKVILDQLKETLVAERHRGDEAESKVKVLQEEVKLIRLRAESNQLTQKLKRQRPTVIRNKLLDDREVTESYNRLSRR